MSRRGKLPVQLSSGIKVDYQNSLLKVSGPKGNLEFQLPAGIDLDVKDDSVNITADFQTADGKRLGGTTRALVQNMVTGVSQGFEKKLELIGVGYRAKVSGQKLTLNLGYSHPIEYDLGKDVKAQMEGNTKITLSSCDKQALGQTAAEIRAFRPPEPYKGKGVKYEDEVIIRKAGKAGKK
ncbi:MAG: large subunit ribosomal protein L6 [bacterium]|jgi:large subunit ribosomal protein L6